MMMDENHARAISVGRKIAAGFAITLITAFCIRMLEWPSWQNPEFRLGDEMLLATHDAYHWLAGAVGFGRAVDHPMSVILANLAKITGLKPAAIAFWIPAVMASLAAGMTYLWGLLLGGRHTAIAAGLIASISPGFLGRTLLGFYDTDIVTLFFPLLIAIAPAWCLVSCLAKAKNGYFAPQKEIAPENRLLWILLLACGGFLAWWTQEWHSVFPYLVRFNIFLTFLIIVCLTQRKYITFMLSLSLNYSLPAIAGPYGLFFPLCMALAEVCEVKKIPGIWARLRKFLANRYIIALLYLLVFALCCRGQIYDTLLAQINAYLKHGGDAHVSGVSALIYPSVAQSIIEVQDLSFAALFPYFHPWLEASLLGFAGYAFLVLKKPAALYLLPLAALGLLASRLGGRMVMFGAPVMALGISILVFWLASFLLRRWKHGSASGWLACGILVCALVLPFLDMIPALSQGPAINRRHAAALQQAGAITPEDATLWLWWDWGYAAHYFARRNTIADGARHGGPSLYLPATVFATDNPRFARQIIRRTSLENNEPGNFFRDMDAADAQVLITRLRSPNTPLIKGAGRQYIIVSFEMLKLGFWISNFGNWNFITCKGEGGALSIVPEAVYYRLNAGEVRLANSPNIIFPASINIFAETGLTRRNYVERWFAAHPNATNAQQQAMLASRRNLNFLFNRVTDEKLVMDQVIYNSLMAQMLLCDAKDARFMPYFRLVYDNVFARIYEVLPAAP